MFVKLNADSKEKKIKKIFLLSCLAIFVLIILLLFVVVIDFKTSFSKDITNPYSSIILNKKMTQSLKTLTRLDEEGSLYFMEYKDDYDDSLTKLPLNIISSGSCSCFNVNTNEDNLITCRNYDVPHIDKNGETNGLNVVLKLTPSNKYASICVADACWITYINSNYYKESLDDGKTNITWLKFLPLLCMDGMNEKGLTCSILALDVRDGEKAVDQSVEGKETIYINQLLRYIIDNCENVSEAIEEAKKYNVTNILGNDYHLFVTDINGDSIVIEYQKNELVITKQNVVTNFYVSSDDASDSYLNGELKEKFPGKAITKQEYRYGYGHGYDRFNKIVTELDKKEKFSYDEAKDILFSVKQSYTGELTSFTQYSAIYNQTDLTVDIYPFTEPNNKKTIKLEK